MSLIIYGWNWCPWCQKAKKLAKMKGISFKFIDIEKNPNQAYFPHTGKKITSAPQIYMNGKFIGGYSDLEKLIGPMPLDIVYE